MVRETDCDVLIIGAGHNGLTSAGYLARAGLLSPDVVRDLELPAFGLEIIDRPSGSFVALPDSQHLWMSRDGAVAKREVAKYSLKDAENLDAFDAELARAAELLRDLVQEPTPNLGGLSDLWQALKLGKRLHGLSVEGQETLAELMTMSVGDYLDRWFESDPVKGVYGFEGVIGNMVSPYHPGTAFVLMYHAFGEINGRTGAWGHAKGGMGSITQAMAKSAAHFGTEIEVSAPVKEVIMEGAAGQARAHGVVLEDGRTITAKAVMSNTNPKLLFERLMDPDVLPDRFRRRMSG